MVNFNQTRGQLSSIEHALKSLQVDLEKAQFALEVKKGAAGCINQHCEADDNFNSMSREVLSQTIRSRSATYCQSSPQLTLHGLDNLKYGLA